MARPPKYGPELHKGIVDNLRIGCSRTTAAELAGIDRHTLNAWCARYLPFRADVQAAIASCKRTASATIRTAILGGDTNAAFRYLGLQEREEWREIKELSLTIELRKKAERIADELGLSVDEVIAEAEAVATGAWDAWAPPR
jgi:hypothetical protein